MKSKENLVSLASEYWSTGTKLTEEGKYERALELFQIALAINRKLRRLEDSAHNLLKIANCYSRLKEYRQAEGSYNDAILIFENINDRGHVAVCLKELALLYQSTEFLAEAEPLFQRALVIDEEVYGPNQSIVARDLENLAKLFHKTDRYNEAEPLFRRVLAIDEKVHGPDHSIVAGDLNNLAELLRDIGGYGEAEALFRRALDIEEKFYGPNHPIVAMGLNNLAGLFRTKGGYGEAEPLFRRALDIKEKFYGPNHPMVAKGLNNLAALLLQIGNYGEAEPLFRRALGINEKVNGPHHHSVSGDLHNLAELLRTTGRYGEAGPLLRRALAIDEKAYGLDHSIVSNDLNSLAVLLGTTGRYGEAELLLRRALAIDEKVYDPNSTVVAATLNNMANLLIITGRYGEAEPLLQRALAIDEKALGPNHPALATDLVNFAEALDSTGRYDEAEPLFRRALAIAQNSGEPDLLWGILSGFSISLAKQGQPYPAIFFLKQAVNTIQGLRANVAGLGEKTLQAYQVSVESVFKLLAALLIETGRFPEAEQVLNLLKQQEFFEYIRRDAVDAGTFLGKVTFTSIESLFNDNYVNKAGEMARVTSDLNTLRHKKELTADEKIIKEMLEEKLEEAGKEFHGVLGKIQVELKGTERAASVKQIEEGSALTRDLAEIGQGVVAIYTLSAGETFHIFLITSRFYKAFSSPIGEKELSKKIFSFRQTLSPDGRRFYDPRDLARELYDIILGPIADELMALKAETLMWYLEGSLRYLPMNVLYDGKKYVVEAYRNVMFTPASQPRLKDIPRADWNGLGLGVAEAHENFRPLNWVKDELSRIIRSKNSPEGIVEGERYLDGEFTWDSLRDGLSKGYPLVHIASHFHLVPGNDTMSFLLLGDGQHLTLDKVKIQSNLFGGVDLLTLSACNTASGNIGQDGGEVESFGVLAQRQGAKAIIASLWPVYDESTSLLMQEFYRLRVSGMDKAEALRQAQLGMLSGRIKPKAGSAQSSGEWATSSIRDEGLYRFENDPNAPFAHPYFWAPFILIGNWK